MLQLKQITKQYRIGEKVVDALNGVTVDFGDKELTAVLGFSGCGKTTLMNIIGGLDKATTGDLIIDGVSTKDYKDSDWNNYRNHQIGFVFQSYNLIPHMTVFSNVELALTLSGVSAKERKKRVLDALNKVGLGDQVYKKPNQMSGGQMQRVAIARAIVNNPKILLADEPTGAVDSSTGIQIMNILKEISKECLVIMVTHNQELADEYANRIIRMQDGVIISDAENDKLKKDDSVSEAKDIIESEPAADKKKKAKMSFVTATKLSFNNLLNKKGRSFITVLSGAISVICIALILAMNSGFAYYINDFEKNNLSRYPIKVTTQTTSIIDLITEAFEQRRNFDSSNVDLTMILDMFREDGEMREKYTDAELVYLSKLVLAVVETGLSGFENMDDFDFEGDVDEFDIISEVFGISLGTDIVEFVKALDNFNPEWGAVMKNYDIGLDVYRKDKKGVEVKLNPVDQLIEFLEEKEIIGMLNIYSPELAAEVSSMLYGVEAERMRQMFDNNNPWSMMIDDATLINAQYDVLAGRLPEFGSEKAMNEIVLVVDEFNQLDDFTLFLLGVIDIEQFMVHIINLIKPYLPPEYVGMADLVFTMLGLDKNLSIGDEYDFEEFIGGNGFEPAKFNLRIPTDYYELDEATGLYNKMGKGVEVEVVGILRLKSDVSGGVISGAIGYTEALAEALIEKGNKAPVIEALNAAFADVNELRNALMNVAMRVLDSNFDLDALANISIPERAAMIAYIAAMTQGLNLSEAQITELMSIASSMEGFEFTPQNQQAVEELITALSGFELSNENYAVLMEAVSLLQGLDLNQNQIEDIALIVTKLSEVESLEKNADILMNVLSGVVQLESNESNFNVIVAAARELSNLGYDGDMGDILAVLTEINDKLSGFDMNSQNIQDIMEILYSLREIRGQDLDTMIELVQMLAEIDYETDGPILQEILELIMDDPSGNMLEIMNLINSLSAENKLIMLEFVTRFVALSVTSDDFKILLKAAADMAALDFDSQNIELILDVFAILQGEFLTADNIDVLWKTYEALRGIGFTDNDIATLTELAKELEGLSLPEEDVERISEVIGLLGGLSLSQEDMSILMNVAIRLALDLDISEEESAALESVLQAVRKIDRESEDMKALFAAVERVLALNLGTENLTVALAMVAAVSELELKDTDLDKLEEIMALVGQIELSESERNTIKEVLELLSGFNLDDMSFLDEAVGKLLTIKLSEEEVEAIWDILRKGMEFLGFSKKDINNVMALIDGIIALNLTEEELEFIVSVLPDIAKLDFSKGETELIAQLGDIFKIRNVTAKEDAENAYIDSTQLKALTDSFALKDLLRPNSVHIYPFSIESRNEVLRFINAYNRGVMESNELANSTIDYSVIYTDELSQMTNSMSSMINTITYILIGVAAIAVVVAMLLVAIILYISVQDRIKEIGLLRSLGASKINISSVFIAETFIIGLVSGIFGVVLALILTLPGNAIIKSILEIDGLLRPVWWHQFALIGIAFVITVISGLIPAALAAKKDPVLALRTE